MNKNTFIILLIILILFFGGCFLYSKIKELNYYPADLINNKDSMDIAKKDIIISNEGNKTNIYYINKDRLLTSLSLGDYYDAQYVNGNLYIVQKELTENTDVLVPYTYTLWKYDLKNNAQKIYYTYGINEHKAFDYYPSDTEELIAIHNFSLSMGDESLCFIKQDGTQAKCFLHGSVDPLYYPWVLIDFSWVGTDFWTVGVSTDLKITDIIKTETNNNFKVSSFDVSSYNIKNNGSSEHDINFLEQLIAFTDETHTKLIIEDFNKTKISTINISADKKCQPQWVGENELQYIDPNTGEYKSFIFGEDNNGN